MSERIDENLFERYLGKSIKDKLGISNGNHNLLAHKASLCSYLIKHLEFMDAEINLYRDDFYYSEYNLFKIGRAHV